MSSTSRKKINARQAVEDILSGMADADLMEKYQLSHAGLGQLMKKLVDAGRLSREQLDFRPGRSDGPRLSTVECPACGCPQTAQRSRCSHCGTVLGGGLIPTPGKKATSGNDLNSGGRGSPHQERSPHAKNSITEFPGSTEHRPSPADPAADGFQTASARFRLPQAASSEPEGDSEEVILEPRRLDTEQLIMLLVGPVVALVCFAIFWFRWTLETFETLVHEMGHTIFGWIFGYPSFPAFDFLWGGGITLHTDRSTALLIAIYLGFGALVVMYRKNPVSAVSILAVAALHAIVSYTNAHSIVVLAMGHGTELAIAGLFVYRSLSGRAVVHAAERPLYAITGFFLLFSDFAMSYRLLTSASHRQAYLHAKGGDIDMDFIRISRDYLNVDMTSVVWVFLICCLLCLLASFLAFRYEEYVHYGVARLWARERPSVSLGPR